MSIGCIMMVDPLLSVDGLLDIPHRLVFLPKRDGRMPFILHIDAMQTPG